MPICILFQEAVFLGAAAGIEYIHPVPRFVLLDFIHYTDIYHRPAMAEHRATPRWGQMKSPNSYLGDSL